MVPVVPYTLPVTLDPVTSNQVLVKITLPEINMIFSTSIVPVPVKVMPAHVTFNTNNGTEISNINLKNDVSNETDNNMVSIQMAPQTNMKCL